jgi:Mlc titration factor MtfA (ptsG expression regulator)
MEYTIGLLLLVALGLAALVGYEWRRRIRRLRLFHAPFPQDWRDYLVRAVPWYSRLPQHLRGQLHGLVNVFLAEKHFEGCQGLTVTDEMRVGIAAEACLLRLNRPTHVFPKLRSILVYPSAYVAKRYLPLGHLYLEGETARLGESWPRGTVVLVWKQIVEDRCHPEKGHHVVLHEFAHQLDQEDGVSDGRPVLQEPTLVASWAQILGREFKSLRRDVASGHNRVLDDYGAVNAAEFFAVATEAFFQKPAQLRAAALELYEELRAYYGIDPAGWATSAVAAK